MRKILYNPAGTLLLIMGIIGIATPGLPTTPFLLASAACYSKGSERLHNWLLDHRILGKYIRRYQDRESLSTRTKISSLAIMWIMISITLFVFFNNLLLEVLLFVLGLIGSFFILFNDSVIGNSKRK
jgi:uncharacterized membrane protein YbaN (DUF454 family)